MSEKIEPALSAEEWRRSRVEWHVNGVRYGVQSGAGEGRELFIGTDGFESRCVRPEAIVAMANDALRDSDARKITRHTIWIMRKLIEDSYIDMQHPGAVEFKREAMRLADALESYLPPEK